MRGFTFVIVCACPHLVLADAIEFAGAKADRDVVCLVGGVEREDSQMEHPMALMIAVIVVVLVGVILKGRFPRM
jgi:hypothetical protein